MQQTKLLNPVRIDPDAISSDGQLRLLLGVTTATLVRARRTGALRHAQKGRRLLYRGQDVLSWLFSRETPGDG